MDKSLAVELMRAASTINEHLNKASGVIEMIGDKEEKTKFRKSVAELMADIHVKLMAPVIQEHRDLDPDRRERR